jgi:hypothetical protein
MWRFCWTRISGSKGMEVDSLINQSGRPFKLDGQIWPFENGGWSIDRAGLKFDGQSWPFVNRGGSFGQALNLMGRVGLSWMEVNRLGRGECPHTLKTSPQNWNLWYVTTKDLAFCWPCCLQGKDIVFKIHHRVYSSLRDFGPKVINNNRSIYFYMRIFEKWYFGLCWNLRLVIKL